MTDSKKCECEICKREESEARELKKHKLEDCPWCENDKNLYMRCEDWDLTEYYVECNYCDSRGPSVVGLEKEAAEKWNQVMGMVRGFKENCIPSFYD